MIRPLLHQALLLAALGLLVPSGMGCLPAGYASCKTDNECPERDGGKLVCYNLRCVECHYDTDCADGALCNSKNTCDFKTKVDTENEPPPPPKSLEECAKRCKGNEGCGASCRDQFKDADKDKDKDK
jgi:hypothetical protein